MLTAKLSLLVLLLAWTQASMAQSSETSAAPETHVLDVFSGTGSGAYPAGTIVNVSADPPPAGQDFAGWSGDISILSNPFLTTTTALMPSIDVSITATYTDQLTLASAPGLMATSSPPRTRDRPAGGLL